MKRSLLPVLILGASAAMLLAGGRKSRAKTSGSRSGSTKIVHIGDSTSWGARAFLQDEYEAAGFSEVVIDHQGGRSMHEHREPKENGVQVAKRLAPKHPRAAWVIMLGTNDAANIAVGAKVTVGTRVKRMMEAIGPDAPVMWVDTKTNRDDKAYADANMQAWNDELEKELRKYPNASLFRWSTVVRPEWYQNDGIHYTQTGSRNRAEATAQAARNLFLD